MGEEELQLLFASYSERFRKVQDEVNQPLIDYFKKFKEEGPDCHKMFGRKDNIKKHRLASHGVMKREEVSSDESDDSSEDLTDDVTENEEKGE